MVTRVDRDVEPLGLLVVECALTRGEGLAGRDVLGKRLREDRRAELVRPCHVGPALGHHLGRGLPRIPERELLLEVSPALRVVLAISVEPDAEALELAVHEPVGKRDHPARRDRHGRLPVRMPGIEVCPDDGLGERAVVHRHERHKRTCDARRGRGEREPAAQHRVACREGRREPRRDLAVGDLPLARLREELQRREDLIDHPDTGVDLRRRVPANGQVLCEFPNGVLVSLAAPTARHDSGHVLEGPWRRERGEDRGLGPERICKDLRNLRAVGADDLDGTFVLVLLRVEGEKPRPVSDGFRKTIAETRGNGPDGRAGLSDEGREAPRDDALRRLRDAAGVLDEQLVLVRHGVGRVEVDR